MPPEVLEREVVAEPHLDLHLLDVLALRGTGDNKNTEPPSAGAGSVLGDVLRDLKQFTARFQLLPTLSDSVARGGSPQLRPSDP